MTNQTFDILLANIEDNQALIDQLFQAVQKATKEQLDYLILLVQIHNICKPNSQADKDSRLMAYCREIAAQ